MVLSEPPDVLLLDEPTTYLDLAVEALNLVDRLHDDLGRTVVMVLHDLNVAVRYADCLDPVSGTPMVVPIGARHSGGRCAVVLRPRETLLA